MTLFEYLAIVFSLVVSVTGMRLVAGLPHAFQKERRYGLHVALVVWQLLATVGLFWIFWSYRDVEWNFPIFLLVLANPGVNYSNACALIPENAAAVESWRDHFFAVRRRYFIGVAAWILTVAAVTTVALDMPWLHPGRLAQITILTGAVLGAVSTRPRVLGTVVLVQFGIYLALVTSIAFRPGSFAQ